MTTNTDSILRNLIAMRDTRLKEAEKLRHAAHLCDGLIHQFSTGLYNAEGLADYNGLVRNADDAKSVESIETKLAQEIGFTFYPSTADEYMKQIFAEHYGSIEEGEYSLADKGTFVG